MTTGKGRHDTVRTRITLTALLATSMLALCGNAAADKPPIPFDGWTVNNGIIDTSRSCSGGVTCTTLVADRGFVQQQVNTAHGSFIRTIVTEADATGNAADLAFADENFIPVNNPGGTDISFKQSIRDSAGDFQSITRFDRHTFTDPQDNTIDIATMDIAQNLQGDGGFSNDFRLWKNTTLVNGGVETYTGRRLDIDQRLLLAADNDPFNATGEQVFTYRQRSGWDAAFNGESLVLDPVSRAGELELDKMVTWNDGEDIATTWVAFRDSSFERSGFNYQTVVNRSQDITGRAIALELPKDAPIDPFAWDEANFGPAPGLP